MHAITPYQISSFKERDKEKKIPIYHNLSSVRSNDTLDMIYKFMVKHSAHIYDYPKEKKLYSFKDINLDMKNRTVSAFFETGKYGIKSEIRDKKTGNLKYPKLENDAEVLKHYIQFTIPSGSTEGLALFHKSMGVGVKSLFADIFKGHFKDITQSTLEFKTYSHKEALSEWIDKAKIKSFNVKGFKGISDITDSISSIAECNVEFSIKPKRKKNIAESSFGYLKDAIGQKKSPKIQEFVEALNEQGAYVTTTAKLNKVSRSFTVGANAKGAFCDILINEDGKKDVKMDGNQPVFVSMQKWSYKLTNDILRGIHKKQAYQLKIPR